MSRGGRASVAVAAALLFSAGLGAAAPAAVTPAWRYVPSTVRTHLADVALALVVARSLDVAGR